MNFPIIINYPWYFILFCILTGLIYTFILYYKSYHNENKTLFAFPTWLLASFRFFSVSIICLLLLSPFIKSNYTVSEKPVIILAIDNTRSVLLNKDSVYYKEDFPKEIEILIEDLSSDYEIQKYFFDQELNRGKSFDFNGQLTNLSSVISDLSEIYYNQNIGAVILATDGIYNQGASPLYITDRFNAPFYTIAIGDTAIPKDIILKDVMHNQIAYLGNDFQVQLHIQALSCNNETTELKVTHKGKVIHSQSISIRDNIFQKDIDLIIKAENPGIQKFNFELSGVENEISYINNSKDIFIDVIDSRNKILLFTQSPHPDIGALKNSISRNEQYEAEVLLYSNYQANEQKWVERLDEYDLIILHQIPGNGKHATSLIKKINEKNIPVWYILGSQSDINIFNTIDPGIRINASGRRTTESFAISNKSFSYFYIDEELNRRIHRFPPLNSPYGEYNLLYEGETIFNKRIGQVETNIPLWAVINKTDQRTAILAGEGIWRWFMHEYNISNSHKLIDETVYKTIQYLSLREDRRQFRIKQLRNIYNEDESVRFEAEVYNAVLEHLRNAKIDMKISSDDGKSYDFLFYESENRYRLDAGYLPPGNYQYHSSTEIAGEKHTYTGQFIVKQIDLEYINTIADHNLLYSIAQRTNGSLVYPDQLDQISSELKSRDDIKTIQYLKSDFRELINSPLLFLFIMIFITFEWFFRKYYGSY